MPAIPPKVKAVVSTDGAVVLNESRHELSALNYMAGYVWKRLEEQMSTDLIVQDIATQSGEKEEVIRIDLEEFLNDLAKRGLLSEEADLGNGLKSTRLQQ